MALWWLYKSKYVATFIIDDNIGCVLTELTLDYSYVTVSGKYNINVGNLLLVTDVKYCV